jgi:ferritin-like protein
MDTLRFGDITPATVDKAQTLAEKVISPAARGSDELIAAYYVMSVIHKIRGNEEGSLRYLLAYGKEMMNP